MSVKHLMFQRCGLLFKHQMFFCIIFSIDGYSFVVVLSIIYISISMYFDINWCDDIRFFKDCFFFKKYYLYVYKNFRGALC